MRPGDTRMVQLRLNTLIMTFNGGEYAFQAKSPLTGKFNTIAIEAPRLDFKRFDDWANGRGEFHFIQDALPDLTPAEREFIMTGYTEEDWAEIFGGSE